MMGQSPYLGVNQPKPTATRFRFTRKARVVLRPTLFARLPLKPPEPILFIPTPTQAAYTLSISGPSTLRVALKTVVGVLPASR